MIGVVAVEVPVLADTLTDLALPLTPDPAFAVTVNTAATVVQAGTIAQATTGAVQFTAGIADNIDAMVNAEGEATAAFGFATDGTAGAGDGDVAVTVADAVTVAEAVGVAGATSGTLQFTTGISGLAATMADAETGAVLEDMFVIYGKHTNLRIHTAYEVRLIEDQRDKIYFGTDVVIGTAKQINTLYAISGINVTGIQFFTVGAGIGESTVEGKFLNHSGKNFFAGTGLNKSVMSLFVLINSISIDRFSNIFFLFIMFPLAEVLQL